ncbi:AAA family ATPase [Kitasatospora purpeofusca]|uniref:AAA family ATPase n=1 Tax=Kitasatospora purpeofusca TaxID=67352 RepID=UPI0036862735
MTVIPAVSPDVFERTVAAYQAKHPGHPLTAGQVEQARALAMSEQPVETIVSIPGTGRSTMLELLACAVRASGGQVIGISPAQLSAHILAESLDGAPVYTLSRWLAERQQARSTGRSDAEFALGPGDVVIVHCPEILTPSEREELLQDAVDRGALVRLTAGR